jgi:hypothetical protein
MKTLPGELMNIHPHIRLLLCSLTLGLSACAQQPAPLPSGTEGAALNAVTGKRIGTIDEKTEDEKSEKEQKAFMARQQEEMRRQQQELDDLKRQKFQDDYFRSQYQNKQ